MVIFRATRVELIEAFKKANIHSLITSLPQGYDSVGECGVALSGCEKQRVAPIASEERPVEYCDFR